MNNSEKVIVNGINLVLSFDPSILYKSGNLNKPINRIDSFDDFSKNIVEYIFHNHELDKFKKQYVKIDKLDIDNVEEYISTFKSNLESIKPDINIIELGKVSLPIEYIVSNESNYYELISLMLNNNAKTIIIYDDISILKANLFVSKSIIIPLSDHEFNLRKHRKILTNELYKTYTFEDLF